MLAKLMEPTMVMRASWRVRRVRGGRHEGGADDGEDADDDDAEGDGGGALGEEIGRDRHGAGAFELEPSGG